MPVPEKPISEQVDIVGILGRGSDADVQLNPDEVFALNAIAAKFDEIHALISSMQFTDMSRPTGEQFFTVSADGRRKSLALTRLEEAEMWALRAVTS